MTDTDRAGQQTPEEREDRYAEFVSLLARHDQSVRRFVRSLLPSPEGVDDVMQETALECWKKFADFRPAKADDEFVRWACVIARYKTLSWQRDKARDRLVFRESVVHELAQESMERIGSHEQERRAVEQCLGEFGEDHRRLILSLHSPGDSVARIAAETGEKARRLYSRVSGLRKTLLACVQRRLAGEFAHES